MAPLQTLTGRYGDRQPDRNGMYRYLVVLMLIAALGLQGCGDETIPCEPEIPAGRIEGFVTSGESLENLTVVFTRLATGSTGELVLETVPQISGYYGMDLPAGYYRVAIQVADYEYRYEYSATELSYGQIPADLLLVDQRHSHENINFSLGNLSVNVSLSNEIEGEDGEIFIYRRDSAATGSARSYINYGRGVIENSACEIYLPGVLPGEYKVELLLGRRIYLCNCPYDGEHIWYPATRDSSQSPWITVSADSTTQLTIAANPVTAILSGEVIGAWQDLNHNIEPEISIFDTDSLTAMGRRRVKHDGTFSIDLHLPGSMKLLVTHGTMQQWVGGSTFEEATVYPVANGETASNIQLIESAIQLSATSAEASLNSQVIRFYNAHDLSFVSHWQYDVDYTNFKKTGINIYNIRPGEYFMHLSPFAPGQSAWLPQWYDRKPSAESALQVVIPAAGEIVAVSVTLIEGGGILGTLVQSAQSTQDYYIVVTPATENLVWGYANLWSHESEFEILGLPDGDWKLGIWPYETGDIVSMSPPAEAFWYPADSNWNDAALFTITDHNEINDIIFTVE
jgi:hypothetical protein